MEKEHGLAELVKLRFPSTARVIVQSRPGCSERQLFLLELGKEVRTGTKAVIISDEVDDEVDRPLLMAL